MEDFPWPIANGFIDKLKCWSPETSGWRYFNRPFSEGKTGSKVMWLAVKKEIRAFFVRIVVGVLGRSSSRRIG